MKKTKLAQIIGVATAAMTASTLAYSQMLEEVVVTARKRSESIQDVPVAVTAITGEDVEMAFTLDTRSLQSMAPNVVFDMAEVGTPGGGAFSIRGISYQDVEKSYDPTVIVAVDDVPLATGTGQVFDLIDVDRIEILRGPQGTLFGKNAVGGLINIHRSKPQLGETSGKIRARAGQFEKYGLSGLLNIGGDEFALKLVAQVEEQGEGFLDNGRRADDPDQTPLSASSVWTRDSEYYTAHLLWAPTDNFTGEVILDHSTMEGTPSGMFNMDSGIQDTVCLVQTFVIGGLPYCNPEVGEPSSLDRDRTNLNEPGFNSLDRDQVTVRMTNQINEDFSLTYIGSWMEMDDDQTLDGDGTPYSIYEFRRWGDFSQTTNEIRLARESGSNLTWQMGVFTASAKASNQQNSVLAALFGTPDGLANTYSVNNASSEAYSFFGEGEYAMMDGRFVLLGGLRYISETKRLGRGEYTYLPFAGGYDSTPEQYDGVWTVAPNSGGSADFNKTVYRFGARYQLTDDVMIYATTSTGFRSGGFSPRASELEILQVPYKPEELTNYELGIKTTLFDGRMRFNATAFHMIYDDMQVESAIPAVSGTGTQTTMGNAGEATISGFEADLELGLTDWWRVMANVGVLDAEYDEFSVDLHGDGIIADETSRDLRRAPELTYGFTSVMNFEMSGGELSLRATYGYTDEYEAYLTNYEGSQVAESSILDASVTYSRDNWRVSLFGRNLLDEDNWTHNYPVNPLRQSAGNQAPGTFWHFAQRRPPSEIGAELVYEF
jgi:iron complex outermembrane receptor protein